MQRSEAPSKSVMVEQRSEERVAASGEVMLSIDRPETLNISAELSDVSDSGFRAEHHCLRLVAGQIVQFRHPRASGKARVVWTRIVGDAVQSGFVVLGYE